MYSSIINDNGTPVSVDSKIAKLLNKKPTNVKPMYMQFRNSIQNLETNERMITDNNFETIASIVNEL